MIFSLKYGHVKYKGILIVHFQSFLLKNSKIVYGVTKIEAFKLKVTTKENSPTSALKVCHPPHTQSSTLMLENSTHSSLWMATIFHHHISSPCKDEENVHTLLASMINWHRYKAITRYATSLLSHAYIGMHVQELIICL